jgi:hypothetical protein
LFQAVPVPHRRHLEYDVIGEQRGESRDVGLLERGDVTVDDGALLGRWLWPRVRVHTDVAQVGSCPLHGTVDTGGRCVELLGGVVRLGTGAEHPIGDGPQVASVFLEALASQFVSLIGHISFGRRVMWLTRRNEAM